MARSKLPARVLNKLLQDCATHTPQCAQCLIGSVVEIPVDETGCNWKVSVIQGGHCGECLAAMADFIVALREQFTLETLDDMDPTLLTTWATR